MLASTEAELGETRIAHELYSSARLGFKGLLGEQHPRSVRATYELGVSDLRMGHLREGIGRLEESIKRIQLPEQERLRADALDALAGAFESAGELDRAANSLEQLIDARMKLTGSPYSEWVIMAKFRHLRILAALADDDAEARLQIAHRLRDLMTQAISFGGSSSPVARSIFGELRYQVEVLHNAGGDVGALGTLFDAER